MFYKKTLYAFLEAFKDADQIACDKKSRSSERAPAEAVYRYKTNATGKYAGTPEDRITITYDGKVLSVHDTGGCSDKAVKRTTSIADLRTIAFTEAKSVITECSWPDADTSRFDT